MINDDIEKRYLTILKKYSNKISVFDEKRFYFESYDEKLPNDKINNFLKNFIIKTESSIIGFYDTSFGGNGKTGYLFLKDKLYYKKAFSKPQKLWYEDIKSVSVISEYAGCDEENKLSVQMHYNAAVILEDNLINKTPLCEFFNEIIKNIETSSNFSAENINIAQNNADNPAYSSGITIQGYQNVNRLYDEEKFHADKGHGFAAERANDLYDKLRGHKTQILGDDNLKNGADRIVDDILIQSKYCKTGSRCIKECFDENGVFRYLDKNGKPMLIEVPSDKYDDAVKSMQDKIKKGKIPGVSNPNEAKNIVKEGRYTYQQAKNIAKAGTVESLKYDCANGIITASCAGGVSAAIALAQNVWNGEDLRTSLKNAALTGIKVGGGAFLVSVATNQFCKAGLNSAMVPFTEAITKAMGSKASAVLINAFRSGKNIHGAAALKSAAKLFRGNAITFAASVIIFPSSDLVSLLRGRMSKKQFVKNTAVTVSSTAGATVGMTVGGALGSIVPGVGNAIGAFIGGSIAGALAGKYSKDGLDEFIDDDSKELMETINKSFNDLANEYLLNKKEAEKSLDILIPKLNAKFFKNMYASKDKNIFIKKIIKPIFEQEIQKRKKVQELNNEQMQIALKSALEEIADDIEKEKIN